MIRISQIKSEYQGQSSRKALLQHLKQKAARLLRIKETQIETLVISRHSLDARKKPQIFDVWSVDIELRALDEKRVLEKARVKNAVLLSKQAYGQQTATRIDIEKGPRPVVAGSGPAGLFCALMLARAGLRPILLERGKCVEERGKDVEDYWQGGTLNPESNVQFGEGGAGTFSDGKLYTSVQDKDGRLTYILKTFVENGADERILYEAGPHIGTDRLRRVVAGIRRCITEAGGEILFSTKLVDLKTDGACLTGVETTTGSIKTDTLVLAIGHSATDTFAMLRDRGIAMEKKAFAMGVRVAHPQSMIDASMYGEQAPASLPSAAYKLVAKATDGRGVYSFCMCPGGYIVNASSGNGGICVNGMSYSGRSAPYANSAIVVTITPEDFADDNLLSGCDLQRALEKRAYQAGRGQIPVQSFGAFMQGGALRDKSLAALKEQMEQRQKNAPDWTLRYKEVQARDALKGLSVPADVYGILPEYITRAIAEGMLDFGHKIKGFDYAGALFAGIESRTSSPVRIVRGEDLQSLNLKGLYPCGEGAGYAGGIMSAAADGLRIAEAILKA